MTNDDEMESGTTQTADGSIDAAEGSDLTYSEALEELESLLEELEGSDTDVDLLAERVARGVELVRFCRTRLQVVSKDVDAVVSELISVEAQGEPDDAPSIDDAEDDT